LFGCLHSPYKNNRYLRFLWLAEEVMAAKNIDHRDNHYLSDSLPNASGRTGSDWRKKRNTLIPLFVHFFFHRLCMGDISNIVIDKFRVPYPQDFISCSISQACIQKLLTYKYHTVPGDLQLVSNTGMLIFQAEPPLVSPLPFSSYVA
jgi:hypothetical protein